MHDIPLFNRRTQTLETETVFEQGLMEFLFGTRTGFWLAERVLKHRWPTALYAHWQHSTFTKAKIKRFVEQYGINTAEMERPLDSFTSFNDFFIRKLKADARQIDQTPAHLISPADARLLAYEIKRDTVLPVKGRAFTLNELLRSTLAADYLDGLCLIFRLAPVDYHRFAYIDDGEQSPVTVIKGFYRSVNPLAIWRQLPVFSENQREACVLHTHNFGDVIHVDVGATGVGRIVQHQRQGGPCQRGQEKGYFEFGGSTSILLFKPGLVKLDGDIATYSAKGIETLVRYGEKIGSRATAKN
ncbi:MAG: phosphatidylserine decarboxylase [Acidobacteria bacterium]|nr:phosphatidylserine decarboxylase [Acidobacteriota bacterium]